MALPWRNKKTGLLSHKIKPSPMKQNIAISFAQNFRYLLNRFMKGTSPSAFLFRKTRAGMAVEAAAVLPIFLFFILNLSCAIEMIRLHGNLQMALWETGHRLAVYGHALGEEDILRSMEAENGNSWWKEMAGIAFSYTFIKNQLIDYLGEDYIESSPITEGASGLHFWESNVLQHNDIIEITVTYGVSPYFKLAGFSPFRMANRYYAHIWNGYDIMGGTVEDEEELVTVYIAETGEVYHRDRNCTHLQLSIQEIDAGTAGNYRNENGGKYVECEKCKGKPRTDKWYIAREGNCFHYSEDCSGLKRTVYTILLKDAGDFRPCSRCGGMGGK